MAKMTDSEVHAARSIALQSARSKTTFRERTTIDRWVLKLAGSGWFPKERAELDTVIIGAAFQLKCDRECVMHFAREEQYIRATSNRLFRSSVLATTREDVKRDVEYLADLQFVKSLFPLANDTP